MPFRYKIAIISGSASLGTNWHSFSGSAPFLLLLGIAEIRGAQIRGAPIRQWPVLPSTPLDGTRARKRGKNIDGQKMKTPATRPGGLGGKPIF
jgi:hypothetical protein